MQDDRLRGRRLLRLGLIGSAVTALCCFTPLLVLVLAAAGVGSYAWFDVVLFPMLAMFAAVSLYALHLLRRRR